MREISNSVQISENDGATMLQNYFRRYTHELKLGIVVFITGGTHFKTGSGKSVTALRLGQLIYKDISIDDVCVTHYEFMQGLTRIKQKGIPGQVLIMDEGELLVSSSSYWEMHNKVISEALATARFLRAVIIVVTPLFHWIDTRIRALATHWGFTRPSMRNGKMVVYLYLYRISTDIFGKDLKIRKLQAFKTESQRWVSIRRFKVKELEGPLREAYEKKHTDFKSKFHELLTKQIKVEEANVLMQGNKLNKREQFDMYWNSPKVQEILKKDYKDLKSYLLFDQDEAYGSANYLTRAIIRKAKKEGIIHG